MKVANRETFQYKFTHKSKLFKVKSQNIQVLIFFSDIGKRATFGRVFRTILFFEFDIMLHFNS